MDSQADTSRALGVWAQPLLGGAWPELKALLHRLYGDRASAIPWLPRGWLQSVRDLQESDPTSLVRVGPGLGTLSPDFCDSDAKRKVWQEFFVAVDAAIVAYAAGKAAEGRAAMEAAYSNSAFWAKAYAVAVFVRDLPKNAVGAVLDGAGDVAGGIFGRLLKSGIVWVALIAVAIFAAWRLGFLKLSKG